MFNKDLIIELLEKKGWSQYKLSKKANMAQSTLSDILTGKNANPRMDTIQKIATALDVTVDSFFDDSVASTDNRNEKNKNLKESAYEEDFDEETRAIARDMKNLSPNKKKLLKDLIKTMTEAGDEELTK